MSPVTVCCFELARRLRQRAASRGRQADELGRGSRTNLGEAAPGMRAEQMQAPKPLLAAITIDRHLPLNPGAAQ